MIYFIGGDEILSLRQIKISGMPVISPNLADHILILLLAIVLPLQSIAAQRQLKHIRFSTAMKIQLYRGNSIGLWVMAALALAVWLISKRTLAELGLEWPIRGLPPLAWWALGFFFALYLLDTGIDLISPASRENTHRQWRRDLSFLPETAYEYRSFILLSFSAGICEEIVFRGYFIRYFFALTDGSPWGGTLAILLPAIIFGAVHIYQGWKAVIKVAAMAVLFGFVFVRSGSLWVLILVHALVDLIGGFISWRLSRHYPAEEEEQTADG